MPKIVDHEERRRELAAAVWRVISQMEQQVAFSGLRDLCLRITRDVAQRGRLAPGLDPEQAATHLHALCDGLTLHLLIGKLAPDARWPSSTRTLRPSCTS